MVYGRRSTPDERDSKGKGVQRTIEIVTIYSTRRLRYVGKKKRRENPIPSFAFQWKTNKRSSSLEGSPAGSARQHFFLMTFSLVLPNKSLFLLFDNFSFDALE